MDGGPTVPLPSRRPLASDGVESTWTAPIVERRWTAPIAGERESLEQWLDFHRETLLMKCAGLRDDQLKARPVPPSGLSLLGLVRHMVEVERWWFRMCAGNEQIGFEYCTDDEDNADFDDLDGADARADLETFRRESPWHERQRATRGSTSWWTATAMIRARRATSAGSTCT